MARDQLAHRGDGLAQSPGNVLERTTILVPPEYNLAVVLGEPINRGFDGQRLFAALEKAARSRLAGRKHVGQFGVSTRLIQ